MAFILQSPGNNDLVSAIREAAVGMESGGGIYAFASKGGVNSFFSIESIISLLSKGRFTLIVGVDAITNAEARSALADKISKFGARLEVRFFLHDFPSSTFHPKFCWFQRGTELSLVSGSGNLTSRGLGTTGAGKSPSGNWEAFGIQKLSGSEASTVLDKLKQWIDEQRQLGFLKSIDDADVLAQVVANGQIRYTQPSIARRRRQQPRPAVTIDNVAQTEPEILLREIPLNRVGQADVGKDALTNFFGYAGKAEEILMQYVSLTNEPSPVIPLQLFRNQSKNYRLELRAIADFEYEVGKNDERMILVATKLDTRSFRYTIVPVQTRPYKFVSSLLGQIPSGGRRLMRERRITSSELKTAWPNVPSSLLLVDLPTLVP